jgi:CheY-like chemotaxis protein
MHGVEPTRQKILVVDDNHDAAEMLADFLEFLKAEVSIAHSGTAALAALKSFRPDVVILDVELPDLNGWQVAERIRTEPEGRTPVLVAVTGWGRREDHQRSREAGIDHHFVKPIDLQALRRLLDGNQARNAASPLHGD